MSQPLVIIGAGGHGREILDIVEAVNARRPTWRVLGFLADDESHPELAAARGVAILGGVSRLAGLGACYVIGIGSSAARARIESELGGAEAATLVHPAAVVGSEVRLDPGCCIAAGAVLTTNIELGRHTHVNVGASISHDVRLGRWCTIAPGVRIGGWARLGDGVAVGIGAVCRDRVTVGDGTIVGAGAVVIDDLEGGVTAVGVPARALPR